MGITKILTRFHGHRHGSEQRRLGRRADHQRLGWLL